MVKLLITWANYAAIIQDNRLDSPQKASRRLQPQGATSAEPGHAD